MDDGIHSPIVRATDCSDHGTTGRAVPKIRSSFGPRENFYLVFAAVTGLGLLVLTVRDAAAGVVGAPAVGLVVVCGLAFLILFGGSDREDPEGE